MALWPMTLDSLPLMVVIDPLHILTDNNGNCNSTASLFIR